MIFKSNSEFNEQHNLQLLAIYAPEYFTRDIDNISGWEDEIKDVALVDVSQDNALYGITLNSLIGHTGKLRNILYFRQLDKYTSQGES